MEDQHQQPELNEFTMKPWMTKLIWGGLGTAIAGVLLMVFVIAYFSFGLPKISSLADYNPPVPSHILSKDGTVLAEIGLEHREVAPIEEIPTKIIDSFLSAEDDKFYDHKGVDYWGVFRALLVNLKAGRVVQGGSTITQQVAKSLLLNRERSISRKIKDFLLAQKIEEKFSKEEILYLYLNQVYLGGGYYGVKSAFRGYFGKELEEATIAESAMIAGLLVAPGKYSPYINPEYAKVRQGYVLSRMLKTGKITAKEYEDAVNEKIKYQLRKKSDFKAGYFTDWVRQRVIDLVSEDKFKTDGFRVQTTLDYELQKVAEAEVIKGVKEIDKRQGFKGPIGQQDLASIREWEMKFREVMFRESSLYFTLTDDFKKKYELEFDPQFYELVKVNEEKWKHDQKLSAFAPGNLEEDRLLDLIKKDESYEAVVLKVLDNERLIFVSIGGLTGVISYEEFKWAHERNITEDQHYWGWVIKPSTIVSPGDIVLVNVMEKSKGLTGLVHKPFENKMIENQKYKELFSEKYIHCGLDQEPEVQGALVSIDPKTSEIVSFVGGTDFSKSQFNRAIQSLRQPGSSFKPFLYALALENGYTPATIIMDSPEALGGAQEGLNWKPRNYDGKYLGPITFRESLEKSRNIPTIKIANDLGVDKVVSFIDRIQLDVTMQEDLSLSLGSFGVNLVDLTAAYGIFPNHGRVVDPKSVLSITDRYGNVYQLNEKKKEQATLEKEAKLAETKIEDTPVPVEEAEKQVQAKDEGKNDFLSTLSGLQVYDKRLAYIMTNLLRGVIHNGTGRKANSLSNFIAGKTGTTSNYVDAWFMGFSNNLITGVWTGFDENQTLGWPEGGSKAALPIWMGYMKEGLKKFGEYDFDAPAGIVNVLIDKATGNLASSRDSGAFMEAFVEGTEPGSSEEEVIENPEEIEIKGNEVFEEEDYYSAQ